MSVYADQVVVDYGAALQGYWPLDLEYGLADLSAHDNDAVPHGSIVIGGAHGPGPNDLTAFSGSGQYLTTGCAPYATGVALTIEMWAVKGPGPTLRRLGLGSGASAPYLFVDASGVPGFFPNAASGFQWGAIFTASPVHHLLLYFDNPNDKGYLYLDGVAQAVGTITTDFAAAAGNVQIGRWNNDANFNWLGQIGHVAIAAGDFRSLAAPHFALGFSYVDAGSGNLSLSGAISGESASSADVMSGALALSGLGVDEEIVGGPGLRPRSPRIGRVRGDGSGSLKGR